MNRNKKRLIAIMKLIGADKWSGLIHKLFYGSNYLRAVNYHGTPVKSSEALERQLAYLQKRFSPVSFEDLEAFFRDKRWSKPKPGLIPTFDDGLRDNYDVAAPLLEKYGFTGWFMTPGGFIDCPADRQKVFAREHLIGDIESDDDRIAMSWDELRDLHRRGHVICCHTLNHVRLSRDLPRDILRREVVDAKKYLEEHLGFGVDAFVWVGGEERNYNRQAEELIEEAGYRFSFTTNAGLIRPGHGMLSIGRINIESGQALDLAKFQLSGFIDLLYYPKRKRVNRLLFGGRNPP